MPSGINLPTLGRLLDATERVTLGREWFGSESTQSQKHIDVACGFVSKDVAITCSVAATKSTGIDCYLVGS